MRAFVVFEDGDSHDLLGLFLKPGFRHCFVVLEEREHRYITVDPARGYMEVTAYEHPYSFPRIADWFRGSRKAVSPIIEVNPSKDRAPLRPLTCVEVCKRVLGIHDRWVFTPYQLFRRLETTA